MYQHSSSSPSSSHKSPASSADGNNGQTRYVSAPGFLFNSAEGYAIGNSRDFSSIGSQPDHPPPPLQQHPNVVGDYFVDNSSSFRLDYTSRKVNSRSSNINEFSQNGSGASSSSLFRQRSSPAGFFSQPSADKTGFSLGGYGDGGGGGDQGPSRSNKTQLSFGGHQDSFSGRISEGEETAINDVVCANSLSFGIDPRSWEASSSSNISFTIDQPGKRPKSTTDFFTIDSPQFSMTHSSSMGMENFVNIPEDSVPCRIRAKRGCATHPRSIAERERRTRISGKLKKLQELVPNMDKQTSYADMLDLAVDHIKGLQHQVEKLKKETEECICGACNKHCK